MEIFVRNAQLVSRGPVTSASQRATLFPEGPASRETPEPEREPGTQPQLWEQTETTAGRPGVRRPAARRVSDTSPFRARKRKVPPVTPPPSQSTTADTSLVATILRPRCPRSDHARSVAPCPPLGWTFGHTSAATELRTGLRARNAGPPRTGTVSRSVRVLSPSESEEELPTRPVKEFRGHLVIPSGAGNH